MHAFLFPIIYYYAPLNETLSSLLQINHAAEANRYQFYTQDSPKIMII